MPVTAGLPSNRTQPQPMLSRVADSMYWMSRYLERMEHTARLLDVNLNQMLDQAPGTADERWKRMLGSLRINLPMNQRDVSKVIRTLTFDRDQKGSILACITAARENAQQVREQISTEMWQQLNQLYLMIRRTSKSRVLRTQPHQFFQQVKEGAHLFQGITDSTMSHDEGWQFIQVGRSIERATSVAALLNAHYRDPDALDYLGWVGLLRSCTAFEAYCRVYTADVKPQYVAEFLLLNGEFPHSVSFAVNTLQQQLQAIARTSGARAVGRPERLAGRLRASLDYSQIDEMMYNICSHLDAVQRQCAEIHLAIHQVYIDYPVGSVLSQ